MKPLEGLLLALLGGFAAAFLFLTRDNNPTAALFPRVIAVVSLLFLTVLVVRLVVGSNATSESLPPAVVSRAAVLGLQGGYVALIYVVGFLPATLLFLFAAPIQMRYSRRGVVLLHGVGVTLVLAASLWLFNIRLPAAAVWNLW
jgi:hypothetical protein